MLRKMMLSMVIVLMLVVSATAEIGGNGYWKFTRVGNLDYQAIGENGYASASCWPGSMVVYASTSGWGNEDDDINGGEATAFVLISYKWYKCDPNDPNASPTGGDLLVSHYADHDNLVLGGIYGEIQENGYISAGANTCTSVTSDYFSDWDTYCYAYGSDSMYGYGDAEAWFDPYEDPLEYWSDVTEYEDPRFDAFQAIMDGDYSRSKEFYVTPGIDTFYVKLSITVQSISYVEETAGDPTTWVETENELWSFLYVAFNPEEPDYVSN